uniref:Uncharacterized protein n=1 Tax=Trepomonas sp. PC1 TaxID=1076344 RepID=A0A146KIJ5_9EUKA|eukprot:JAP96530.1 hypothetical protein TPC1_10105 [Trepomonas sp. PC1]
MRAQRPANLNIDQQLKDHQQYLTEKYELVQEEQKKNKSVQEVQSDEKDVRLSASYIPEMVLTKVEPKHLRISFTEMVSLIQIELDYVCPQEIFNVLAYICFSSKQYPAQQLKQFDKSAKQFDIQSFLKLFYIFSPEQYQKIMKNQVLILYYYVDDMFNTLVDMYNLKSLLTFHFKNIEIDQFVQLFDETLIDLDEFEANFAKKQKLFEEDVTVYLSGMNVKEFYRDFNAKQKHYTKQIDQCIQIFMTKNQLNLRPIRGNNQSQAALLDDDQMNEEKEMRRIKQALGE